MDVTVVAKDRVPFEKQRGTEIGGAFLSLHEQYGVHFRLGRNATTLEGGSDVQAVVHDGERLPTDFVVIGAGIAPATQYAGDLPRAQDGSILVDDHLRAADNVYVAGDIASFP